MRALDTVSARMDALTDAIRTLVPVLIDIRRRHGTHVTRLALSAALQEYEREAERRHRTRPALALARARPEGRQDR